MAKFVLIFSICALNLLTCSEQGLPLPLYSPTATFAGYVNNQYCELSGNWQWPNRCMLIGDTVRMYFYSSTFSEINRIRNGDLLRLDLYPGIDTLVGKRSTLLHMARYYDFNSSYDIHPTNPQSADASLGARARHLDRFRGGKIRLELFFAATGPVKGTNAERLEIRNATIEGTVE